MLHLIIELLQVELLVLYLNIELQCTIYSMQTLIGIQNYV